MEGYLGQVCRSRSKVKVTRSKNVSMGLSIEWLSELIDAFSDEDAKARKKPENTSVQKRRGVFSKRMRFCLNKYEKA